jgi:hypothetical protein
MGEHVRRIRLLVVVGVVGVLALLAAWPGPNAAAQTAPLYLARQRAGGDNPATNRVLVVADGPGLVAHLQWDNVEPATLDVIDSTGRVVVLEPDGDAVPTGAVLEPEAVRSWLGASFQDRWRLVDSQVMGDQPGATCWSEKQAALSRLTLPTHQGDRTLTLTESLAETEVRLAALHRPENQIPVHCFRPYRGPVTGHRAGYLHNLWHRLTGTSGSGSG